MKKIFFLLSVVVLSICSCESRSQLEAPKYTVDFDDSIIDISAIASDISIIELENTYDAILPSIEEMSIFNDRIYCFSSLKGGVVCVFDLDGKFLYNIKHIGKAQNEWINLTNMFVNGSENIIALVDNGLSKVLLYDLDGKFVKSQSFDSNQCFEIGYGNGLYYVVNNCLLFNDEINSGSDHKINLYDESSMKMVGRLIPTRYNDSKIVRNVSSTLKCGIEGFIEVPSLDETVYLINKDQFVPYASYKYLGSKEFYTESDIQLSVENDEWLMGKSKMFYSNAFVESPQYLIRRVGSEFGIDVIYDKTSNKVVSTQFDFFFMGRNHLSEKIKYAFPLCYYKGRYYGVMDIDALSAPREFLDGYVPEDIQPICDNVKENKVNKVLVSYKINIDNF